MVDRLEALLKGYSEFRATTYAGHRDLYHDLAEHGQSPEIMVIACCDSRVEPAAIFSAPPGALFVVRNVANLVPPYKPDGDYPGTVAALEFAVTGLGVKRIVVLGHAQCGGVKAFIESTRDQVSRGHFIDKWMSILEPACEIAKQHSDPAETQQAMEKAAIGISIENLKSFPFVRERLDAGTLTLHAGYVHIGSGALMAYRESRGGFEPVWPDGATEADELPG